VVEALFPFIIVTTTTEYVFSSSSVRAIHGMPGYRCKLRNTTRHVIPVDAAKLYGLFQGTHEIISSGVLSSSASSIQVGFIGKLGCHGLGKLSEGLSQAVDP
jgi:hypothetical protein